MKALVTGATGFVGGQLAHRLAAEGAEVRCLVRTRSRAAKLREAGFELHEGDALDAAGVRGAGDGVDVAYYLIHSMGRGASGGEHFGQRDREAAVNFARMAREEGVERVVYLGGLGDHTGSPHLRSRHETATVLAREGPPLTYFRAAMVVGSESESYRTLRYLVSRLPVMIAPAWLRIPTQPIGVHDVLSYLAAAPRVDEAAGREVQIGGPDVLTYGEMIGEMADALGKRRPPMVPVPLLTPTLSSLWIGLVTPVDADVARPLIEGLGTETVVADPSGARLFDVEPRPFHEVLADAVAHETRLNGAPTPLDSAARKSS
ncbi:MAG TPA: NAD(P)H-binding protein [Solirubrobacterales bacterium]|nr:NAD(P)H-binding protein [Solirubrobacterales bacterium]